jgi:exopolysaccharide production protein ExoZ
MNAKTKHITKLEGLQVLRGVAALLVMWCHLKYNLGVPSTKFSNVPALATDLGAIGVDIFFVISGFVIAMTGSNLGWNWRAFLAHRIARVVPLYFTLSSYVLVLAIIGLYEGHILTTLSFRQIFNTYAFIPVFDTGGFSNPLCVNGWTLSFEIWFYLCFAWLIKFVGGQQAGRILPLVMAAGVVVTAAFYHSDYWFLPKFLFHPLVLEFSAGCILYHARNLMGKRTLIALSILVPIFLYFANQAQFLGKHWIILSDSKLGLYRAGVWGGFAFCLVGMVTQIDLKHSRSWPKFLLLLGDASYSIYLIAPLIVLPVQTAIFVLNKMIGYKYLTLPPFLCGIIYVFGTIVGGIVLWKFFEVPTTLRVKRLLSRFVPKEVSP